MAPSSLSQGCRASQVSTAPEPSSCICIHSLQRTSPSTLLPHRKLLSGQNFSIKIKRDNYLGQSCQLQLGFCRFGIDGEGALTEKPLLSTYPVMLVGELSRPPSPMMFGSTRPCRCCWRSPFWSMASERTGKHLCVRTSTCSSDLSQLSQICPGKGVIQQSPTAPQNSL